MAKRWPGGWPKTNQGLKEKQRERHKIFLSLGCFVGQPTCPKGKDARRLANQKEKRFCPAELSFTTRDQAAGQDMISFPLPPTFFLKRKKKKVGGRERKSNVAVAWIMEMGKEDGRYVNPKTFTSDLFFLSFPLCLAATYDENPDGHYT